MYIYIYIYIYIYTYIHKHTQCGPGSSVGTATELGAGRSGIESRWGGVYPSVQTAPGAHPVSSTTGTGSYPGGKVRPGREADPLPSSAEVLERVKLYLYSPKGLRGL